MKVNFLVRTIELTAEEMRQASKPNSREYTDLLQIMRDLPDFQITVKHRCITSNANRGLTYEYMEQHIARHAPEKMEEFYLLKTINGYPKVTKWFRNRFPEVCGMVHFCTNQEPAA